MKSFSLKTILIYIVAFLLPVAAVGTCLGFVNLSRVMIPGHVADEPLAATQPALDLHPGHLKAVIVLGRSGTQLTELLAPLEVLGRSGKLDVIVAAPDRKPLPTTGSVSVLPGVAFRDAPEPDLLVVPSILDPAEQEVADYVKMKAPQARLILSLGEGARVLAAAHLLDGRRATAHFLALPGLRLSTPGVHWVDPDGAAPVLRDGKFLTSAGVAASVEATQAALSALLGAAPGAAGEAAPIAKRPPASRPHSARARFTGWDLWRLLLREGLEWGKPAVGVLLYPGVDELSLSAALETTLRSQAYAVSSISPEAWVRTRHGLLLHPSEILSDESWLDTLVIPAGTGPLVPLYGNPEKERALTTWLQSHPVDRQDLRINREESQPFERAISRLSDHQGRESARRVALLMEYPGPVPASRTPDYPLLFWFRVLGVGFIGVFGVWMARVRLSATAYPTPRS